MFKDRRDAGRKLAENLARYRGRACLVLALPRGGVPVGYEIARSLRAPLDLLIVRKLGAPGQRELAIGAVIDDGSPRTVLNEAVIAQLDVSPDYLKSETERQLLEIERQKREFRHGRPPAPLQGRVTILVDDGIATGATALAAIRALRGDKGPEVLVLAVPVAPPETVASLRGEVDELVCLSTPRPFGSVGAFYEDFEQVSDEEVARLLKKAAQHG